MANNAGDRLRFEVAARAYHVCEYCLIHESDTFWGCQVDHVISRKHGGATDPVNLAWACAVCNNNKGTDLGTITGANLRLRRLFHPRNDRWLNFFILNTPRIDSVNPVGEATAKLLKFNSETRLREREVLAQIGRFPTIEALARMRE